MEHITLLSSLCVISSVCWSGGVSSQASVSEEKREFYSSLARYASAFAFEMNSKQIMNSSPGLS